MPKNNRYCVFKRRKREGKTHYKKRLKILISRKTRLVIRKSSRNIVAQAIKFDPKGDIVLLSSDSKKLASIGYKLNTGNITSAYLTGLRFGIIAKKKGIGELILDLGLYKSVKGSRIYACLKGVIDAGIKVPFSEDILPSEERIKGLHISKYAELLSKEGKNVGQFSTYKKEGVDPNKISEHVKEMYTKVGGEHEGR